MTKVDDYRGHVISLNPIKRFVITGPLYEEVHSVSFETWDKAVELIDKRSKAKNKEAQTKLDLPIVTSNGILGSIKGLHSVQGKLLFTDGKLTKDAGSEFSYVYPDIEPVRRMAERVEELTRQVNELKQKLRPFQISISYTYGFKSAEGLEEGLAKLQAEYAAKAGEALKVKFP